MVDDKYIGLALAISSSFAIGSSFIITKKVDYSHLITNGRTVRLVFLPYRDLTRRRGIMQHSRPTPLSVMRTYKILSGGLGWRQVHLNNCFDVIFADSYRRSDHRRE